MIIYYDTASSNQVMAIYSEGTGSTVWTTAGYTQASVDDPSLQQDILDNGRDCTVMVVAGIVTVVTPNTNPSQPTTVTHRALRTEQWGSLTACNSPNKMNDLGMYIGQYSDANSSSGIDSDGLFLKQDTASTINHRAITDMRGFVHRLEFNPEVLIKFKIPNLTNVRFYAAFVDTLAFNTLISSDDPSAEFSGIRFSTSVPDTNFIFATKDGTTLTTQDSGVAVTTEAYYLKMQFDTSVPKINLALFSGNFTQLASHTFTTNLPAAATDLGIGCGIENLTAASRSIQQYVFEGINNF